MKVNEIIYEAMKRLNVEGEHNINDLDNDKAIVSKLLFSLNNVLSELTEVCGFKTVERVESVKGKVCYTQLSQSAYKIVSVKMGGIKVAFSEKDSYIAINGSGMCDIEYCYRIKTVSTDDEVSLPPNISISNLALGVAGDYCLNVSRLEDAAAFNKKYKAAINNAMGLKRTVYVPVRNKW